MDMLRRSMLFVRVFSLAAALCVALVTGACGGGDDDPNPGGPTPPGAPYSQTDLTVGTGTEVTAGRTVTVNYSGWLYDPTRPENKGTGFDAQNGARFQIGVGMVIAGWDRGVPGMRVGGIRRLVVPPELGYGAAGRGPVPPNATMVFDIELVAVQ
jgi:FKBP-type peptidyl-prolyl cis-trans isomerase FkpA